MPRGIRYVVVAVLALIALGAAVVYTRASPIQPLERLPGGIVEGPDIESITDSSAVISLKTAAAAFCQVNYGITPAYGVMRRMNMAGAMTDHRILLPGLQPETVYHVRLTAVDAQARIYQSGDLTFTTVKATGRRPEGQNVAALSGGAKVVGVSSNYGGGDLTSTFGGNNAIDGNPSTEWSSNGDGDKAWIEIELARPSHLSTIGFWTRTMGTSAQIQQFEVVADGQTRLGPFTLGDAGGVHYFRVQLTARRLRFNVLKSTGGNTGAIEIEALATP